MMITNLFHPLSPKATILRCCGSGRDNSLNFISLKETIKVIGSEDTLVYLASVRLEDFEDVPYKQMKKKTKTNTQIGAAHGLAKGEKRRMFKESGPRKDKKQGRILRRKW